MINFILILLIAIIIFMMFGNMKINSSQYLGNTEKIENFSQNMEGTLCPGTCSNKRYSLKYLYTQPCGVNTPQTRNFCEPYYIPPLTDKTQNMFYYFNKDYLGGKIPY